MCRIINNESDNCYDLVIPEIANDTYVGKAF
jgi:hypothetical protein